MHTYVQDLFISLLKRKSYNTKVVENGEFHLRVKGILKPATERDKYNKIYLKILKTSVQN